MLANTAVVIIVSGITLSNPSEQTLNPTETNWLTNKSTIRREMKGQYFDDWIDRLMDRERLYKLAAASWIACQVGALIEAQFINKL